MCVFVWGWQRRKIGESGGGNPGAGNFVDFQSESQPDKEGECSLDKIVKK